MKKKRSLMILAILLILSGCNRQQPAIPKEVLSADIIYSTIVSSKEQSAKDVIGYYDIENKSGGILELEDHAPIHPYFLNSSSLIFTSKAGFYGWIGDVAGNLVLYSNGVDRTCRMGADIAPFNGNIVLTDAENIYLIDSEDCTVIKTLLTRNDLSELSKFPKITGFSLALDGKFILFQLYGSSALYRVNLSDKHIEQFATEGMNPSISPDQKWVVYLASDGIRISDIDGLNSRKLVSANTMSVVNGQFLIFDSGEPPQPQWSPDSKELIYHKCIYQNCSNISDYNIYIYNLEANEETLVIEGGMFPSWNYYK